MLNVSMKLLNGVEFSNGWAELTLKNPPPFVPSCLMAIWLAAGPPARTWVVPSSVVTSVCPWKFWMTPWLTSSDGDDERQREEDAHDRAGEVDPEVAERLGPAAGQAANQRRHHRHAGGRRHEVLHGETGHLGEMTHRRLTAVGLPVRVRHEADGRVEREVRHHPRHAARVERQRALEALEEVDAEERHEAEPEHRVGVDGPALLAPLVHAAGPVDQPLDREEDAVARRPPVAVDAGHVATEQRGARRTRRR